MKHTLLAKVCLAAMTIAVAIPPSVVRAESPDEATTLREVKREIVRLTNERAQDLKVMQKLESTVDQIQARDAKLMQKNQELEIKSQEVQQSQQKSDQQLKTLQAKVAASPTPTDFSNAVNHYLGTNRFMIAGGAAGSFIYDNQSNINTYNLLLEPIIFWRLNDKLLFEGTIEAGLPSGGDAEFQLPVDNFQYFLNDYMTIVMGTFDQPFGDFYEDQSAVWVNRFVTSPLPYGSQAIVPDGELGVQVRGGYQWGQMGQIVDYTLWTGNGPTYSSATCTGNAPGHAPLPDCSGNVTLVGDQLNGLSNIKFNTHTPSFGGRVRVYPLPVDSEYGRLELGASTYDGKWENGMWYNSWGVDFNYFRGNLQARGEWIQTYRQMPSGSPSADNRQGWYVQVGYMLNGLKVPGASDDVNRVIGRFEPLIRYSGVNQRAVVQGEIDTTPGVGSNGSLSVFTPHAREVALGLDYWITPSIVWQNEIDFELPEAGGYYSDTGKPVGSTPNDHAFLSQFSVGF
jgi:hypothetical protein